MEQPPRLQLDLDLGSATSSSFKRTFEDLGFDLDEVDGMGGYASTQNQPHDQSPTSASAMRNKRSRSEESETASAGSSSSASLGLHSGHSHSSSESSTSTSTTSSTHRTSASESPNLEPIPTVSPILSSLTLPWHASRDTGAGGGDEHQADEDPVADADIVMHDAMSPAENPGSGPNISTNTLPFMEPTSPPLLPEPAAPVPWTAPLPTLNLELPSVGTSHTRGLPEQDFFGPGSLRSTTPPWLRARLPSFGQSTGVGLGIGNGEVGETRPTGLASRRRHAFPHRDDSLLPHPPQRYPLQIQLPSASPLLPDEPVESLSASEPQLIERQLPPLPLPSPLSLEPLPPLQLGNLPEIQSRSPLSLSPIRRIHDLQRRRSSSLTGAGPFDSPLFPAPPAPRIGVSTFYDEATREWVHGTQTQANSPSRPVRRRRIGEFLELAPSPSPSTLSNSRFTEPVSANGSNERREFEDWDLLFPTHEDHSPDTTNTRTLAADMNQPPAIDLTLDDSDEAANHLSSARSSLRRRRPRSLARPDTLSNEEHDVYEPSWLRHRAFPRLTRMREHLQHASDLSVSGASRARADSDSAASHARGSSNHRVNGSENHLPVLPVAGSSSDTPLIVLDSDEELEAIRMRGASSSARLRPRRRSHHRGDSDDLSSWGRTIMRALRSPTTSEFDQADTSLSRTPTPNSAVHLPQVEEPVRRTMARHLIQDWNNAGVAARARDEDSSRTAAWRTRMENLREQQESNRQRLDRLQGRISVDRIHLPTEDRFHHIGRYNDFDYDWALPPPRPFPRRDPSSESTSTAHDLPTGNGLSRLERRLPPLPVSALDEHVRSVRRASSPVIRLPSPVVPTTSHDLGLDLDLLFGDIAADARANSSTEETGQALPHPQPLDLDVPLNLDNFSPTFDGGELDEILSGSTHFGRRNEEGDGRSDGQQMTSQSDDGQGSSLNVDIEPASLGMDEDEHEEEEEEDDSLAALSTTGATSRTRAQLDELEEDIANAHPSPRSVPAPQHDPLAQRVSQPYGPFRPTQPMPSHHARMNTYNHVPLPPLSLPRFPALDMNFSHTSRTLARASEHARRRQDWLDGIPRLPDIPPMDSIDDEALPEDLSPRSRMSRVNAMARVMADRMGVAPREARPIAEYHARSSSNSESTAARDRPDSWYVNFSRPFSRNVRQRTTSFESGTSRHPILPPLDMGQGLSRDGFSGSMLEHLETAPIRGPAPGPSRQRGPPTERNLNPRARPELDLTGERTRLHELMLRRGNARRQAEENPYNPEATPSRTTRWGDMSASNSPRPRSAWREMPQLQDDRPSIPRPSDPGVESSANLWLRHRQHRNRPSVRPPRTTSEDLGRSFSMMEEFMADYEQRHQPPPHMMAGRPWRMGHLGDYISDEDFDDSYDGLLRLGAVLGEVRSRATPARVLAGLPVGTYKEWAREGTETRCPICLDDYEDESKVQKLTECNHWFHEECLGHWLRSAQSCPVCRTRVYKPHGNANAGSPNNGPGRAWRSSFRHWTFGQGAPPVPDS